MINNRKLSIKSITGVYMKKIEDILKKLYDTNIKFGLWAYEHEIKKNAIFRKLV